MSVVNAHLEDFTKLRRVTITTGSGCAQAPDGDLGEALVTEGIRFPELLRKKPPTIKTIFP